MRSRRRQLAILLLLPLPSCQSAPADLREWRPADHDHTENPNAAQVEIKEGGAPSPAAMMGIDEVTLAAWKGNCTVCHGLIGHGDGPKGPGTHARDLSDPAWQSQATDEQIATTIKNGRGQMPRFDLPDSTIKGLTRLVRLLNASRTAGAESDDDDSDQPSSAADQPRDAGARDAGKARDAAARADAAKAPGARRP